MIAPMKRSLEPEIDEPVPQIRTLCHVEVGGSEVKKPPKSGF